MYIAKKLCKLLLDSILSDTDVIVDIRIERFTTMVWCVCGKWYDKSVLHALYILRDKEVDFTFNENLNCYVVTYAYPTRYDFMMDFGK